MTSKEKYMLIRVSQVDMNKTGNAITYCKTRTSGTTLVVSNVAMSSTSSSGKVQCHSGNRSSVRKPKACSSTLDASAETYLDTSANSRGLYLCDGHLHAVAKLRHDLVQFYPSVHENSLWVTIRCKA